MNKFEFHFVIAFYNYFKDKIPKSDYLLAFHMKDYLEKMIILCDSVLERSDIDE